MFLSFIISAFLSPLCSISIIIPSSHIFCRIHPTRSFHIRIHQNTPVAPCLSPPPIPFFVFSLATPSRFPPPPLSLLSFAPPLSLSPPSLLPSPPPLPSPHAATLCKWEDGGVVSNVANEPEPKSRTVGRPGRSGEGCCPCWENKYYFYPLFWKGCYVFIATFFSIRSPSYFSECVGVDWKYRPYAEKEIYAKKSMTDNLA